MRCTTFGWAALVVLSAACSKDSGTRQELPREAAMAVPTQAPPVIDPSAVRASSKELLERGAALYARNCAACHGGEGQADGPAAYLLYPKPRNFNRGQFRFVSTWDGIPTDEDLYRTVSRGIPGSAMPSWANLPEEDRWALVHFTKSLSTDPLVVPENGPGQGVIPVPAEPPADAASVARGAELFRVQCVRCHGERGKGDGPSAATLKDDADIPIRPRDLTSGVFKGDRRSEQLVRRILGGIPGTPMPASDIKDPADAWHLVHYVLSLSSETLRQRAEMWRFRIQVPRVAKVPDHPDSGAWGSAPSVDLHLMPLWWRYKRPEFVTVQALHDGNELALLLEWADDTDDKMAIRPQDFRDAVAVEFATGEEEPFFAMGHKGQFVNIWMWKSERQADLAMFHDIEAQYPNVGIDTYPNSQKAPYEQPLRNALTLASDPTFITGWGAGNIVSDPTRESAAEDLSAQGFGTLKARPPADQAVNAVGAYGMGSYRVMFRRSLEPQGSGAVRLASGTTVPVAFAIWNGSAGDRDGKKSVSIWQDLVIIP